jgi:surface protein
MATGSFKLPLSSASSSDWTRPADWLAMPTGITSANETFVGLHAVIQNSDNYCAFRFTTSAGQYQVDWGDGTIDLVNSNVIAQHQYDYATYDPSNTTLSTRGYKQAFVTVTAVSGNLLTCNFQIRFVTSPVQNQNYSTGFLDCILSMPNASVGTSITFSGNTVGHRYLERIDVKTIGSCTNMSFMFMKCFSLQSVPLFNTANVTNMTQMFNNCNSLKTVPLFNTSNVTNMSHMFSQCSNLQFVPLFTTSSVTDMSRMFLSCASFNYIPALSTTSITTTSGTDFGIIFQSCNSLNRCEMVFARTVSLSSCQLSQTALVEVFNNLVDRTATTSATITISGNWGASALTAGERAIATSKNWVIVG